MVDRAFRPINKPRRAFEEIAATIKASILSGVWKPGDRLPAETELSHQFGVSRNTIREALRTLELSGLITIRTGVAGGPIVKDTIISCIGDLYLDAFQMEKITVEEFTAARQAIEKLILNEAIDKANEEDIIKLKHNIAKAKALVAKKQMATDVNFEFHSLLAAASKNRVFVIMEKAVNTIHHTLRSRTPVDFNTTKNAVHAHEKLLEALIKKERETSMNLMAKHIAAVRKSYHADLGGSQTATDSKTPRK